MADREYLEKRRLERLREAGADSATRLLRDIANGATEDAKRLEAEQQIMLQTLDCMNRMSRLFMDQFEALKAENASLREQLADVQRRAHKVT